MEKEKIVEVARYCSENECVIRVKMNSGERETGTALHLVKDEFLIIRTVDVNDLINIAEVDRAECTVLRKREK